VWRYLNTAAAAIVAACTAIATLLKAVRAAIQKSRGFADRAREAVALRTAELDDAIRKTAAAERVRGNDLFFAAVNRWRRAH